MKETISMKLFRTLQKGREQLSAEALGRVSGFVESQRTEDDAFVNKSGQEDLYYTLFGWMLSYVLGIRLDYRKAARYLERQDIKRLDLIHYAAYVRCRMILQLMKSGKIGILFRALFSLKIKSLNEFDGLPHDDLQSPYTRFIQLSLLEDTGHKINTENESDFSDYHASGGGFMNTRDGLTATTNATVAALAVKGQLFGYRKGEDIFYLRELQDESGGFGAAVASPIPDLLSTATALFMLRCYGIKPKYPTQARDFVEAHWLDAGGFAATLMDEKSDVEYTFYALLALGAISSFSD